MATKYETLYDSKEGSQLYLINPNSERPLVYLHGRIVGGQAKALFNFMKSDKRAMKVREMQIQSPGGSVHAGNNMYKLVRLTGWNTRARGTVASAATTVFFGGRNRSLVPNTDAKIGLHSSLFVSEKSFADTVGELDIDQAGKILDVADEVIKGWIQIEQAEGLNINESVGKFTKERQSFGSNVEGAESSLWFPTNSELAEMGITGASKEPRGAWELEDELTLEDYAQFRPNWIGEVRDLHDQRLLSQAITEKLAELYIELREDGSTEDEIEEIITRIGVNGIAGAQIGLKGRAEKIIVKSADLFKVAASAEKRYRAKVSKPSSSSTTATQKKSTKGLVTVPGYTKTDGTKVKEYTYKKKK